MRQRLRSLLVENLRLALLIFIDLFFVFLVWLAAPHALTSFTLIIILFTLMIVLAGFLIETYRKQKLQQAFAAFVKEPNEVHANALIKYSPRNIRITVQQLSEILQRQAAEINESHMEVVRYQDFIESWAHEIKMPLSLATLILANHEDEMSSHVLSRMSQVKMAIERDVDRILYYARLQADHVDYHFVEMRLDTCLLEVLKSFYLSIQEQGVELRLNLIPITVMSDAKVLPFILTQILSNALKYTAEEQGFIDMTIGLDEAQQKIRLSIRDNGRGVLAEDAPFIFDKGFTGSQAVRQNATGMGLYFVEKYAHVLAIELELLPCVRSGDGFGIALLFPRCDV